MEAYSIERSAPTACLDVVSGPAAGQRLALGRDIQFGRDEPGEGALGGDVWLSSAHAAIRRGASGYFEVEDLGSLEGTKVNGEVVRAPRQLQLGDVIEVGSTRMVVNHSAAPPAGAYTVEPAAPPAVTTTPAPASDGARVLGAIVDLFVEGLLAYVALRVFQSYVLDRGTNVVLAAIGFLIAVQWSYRFLAESLTGQTVGKRLCGTRVVRLDGRPLDPNAVLIRTLALAVDGILLIGLVVMVVSGRRRRGRIGDLVAGTIVVPATVRHAGFSRRERDRLMLASPLLWLTTIAVALRLLGPGLQSCADAHIDPPIANEGSCLRNIGGRPIEFTVADAGHTLRLPEFDVRLERSKVKHGGSDTLVRLQIAVTSHTSEPPLFERLSAAIQLWIPLADASSVPVAAQSPPRLSSRRGLAVAGSEQVGWVSFRVPTEALGSITDPGSDFRFFSSDGRVGDIRLWRAANDAGRAALAGLTR